MEAVLPEQNRGAFQSRSFPANQSLDRQKPHNRFHRLTGGVRVDAVRLVGVQGKRLCLPDLPVVVQRGRVVGLGRPQKNVGQAECQCLFLPLVARLHNADMGQQVAGQIEAGEVDAVRVALNGGKNMGGNALGGLPLVIAGEHPVDVRVVRRPEPAAYIHGKLVGTGHHQDAAVRGQQAVPLQLLQSLNKLGADIHLLDLVAPEGAHDGKALFLRVSKAPALHRQGMAVRGIHGK